MQKPTSLVWVAVFAALIAPALSRAAGLATAQLAQRAVDVQDIQNAMGKHVWYHASFMNDVELEKDWVTTKPYTDTAVWAQNSMFWKGLEKIKGYYGAHEDQKNQPGSYQFHNLTSPIIVVADDRKTAKGIWYTPGIVGGYKMGFSLYERYGVDFVNENGHWKIWHLHVYTDFAMPAPLSAAVAGERFGSEGGSTQPPPAGASPGGPGASPSGPPPMPAGGMPTDDMIAKMLTGAKAPSYRAKIGYRELGATSYPLLVPRMPEPYKTFTDSFSYADPDEYANALNAIGVK